MPQICLVIGGISYISDTAQDFVREFCHALSASHYVSDTANLKLCILAAVFFDAWPLLTFGSGPLLVLDLQHCCEKRSC